jgi:hypothetical protein
MFCTKCGTDLPDDSQFCRKCGQSLSVASTSGGAAAAVAPAKIATPVEPSATDRGGRLIGTRVLPALLLLLLIWFFMRINYGSRVTSQAIATVVHTPITLKDEVQNLPANSWRAVGLTLPYSGTINIDLRVVSGNPVDVFLTREDQLETIKTGQWNNVQGVWGIQRIENENLSA